MDFKLSEEQLAKKKEFDDFFKEEMDKALEKYPGGESFEGIFTDIGWEHFQYMKKRLVETGYLTMAWPKEYGGQDASIIDQLLFNEAYSYYRGSGIDGWGVKMFAPSVMLHATEEQKQRILPPIAKGEVQYCQGWSEPNAGSDLAALSTTAILKGDHYVVNGQKIWTTGAQRADRLFLLARTDPNQTRSRGLSVFNVDMSLPGIEVRPILYMDGSHHYNEVFFTDVEIPVEERVGTENEGWKQSRDTMNFERSGAGVYVAHKRTLEGLIDYIKTTKRNGRYLSEDPLVKQKIGRIYMDIEAGRSLSYRIAWLQEKGNMVFSPSAASESKVHSSELRQRIANLAIEIFGLHGQLNKSKWAPMNGSMVNSYQGSIGENIASGSNEIQRNIIAWVGVNLPRFK
jgi:alkylation response protein AidB-like acyl-CoA dehydrogenase